MTNHSAPPHEVTAHKALASPPAVERYRRRGTLYMIRDPLRHRPLVLRNGWLSAELAAEWPASPAPGSNAIET